MQAQLQVMSSYSLLHSPLKLTELVDKAKERGYQAIALTDINNLYGSIDFYKYARKQGIKPIIGLVIEVNGIIDVNTDYNLILLAKNNQGYKNLIKISSLIMSSKEKIQIDDISEFMSGIFVITPSIDPEILNIGNLNEYFTKLKNLVDKDSLYLGIGLYSEQINIVKDIRKVSQDMALPLVALGDVRYINDDDHLSYQVLNFVRTGDKFDNLEQIVEHGDHYLHSAKDFSSIYKEYDLDQAVNNSEFIADQCNVEIKFQNTELPKFDTPGTTSANYLRNLAVKGLKKRLNDQVTPEYQKRLDYELQVIDEMGFSDYFLIVWDVIKHAHQVGIKTGPGRGSAAGSLVSYTLGITQVDPIKYDLLFERFLNPQRVNMPDIDLDLPDDRRDEMVEYMHDKYGSDHMAQIITFGTLAAKMALRDISRTFGQTQFQLSKWSDSIPRKLNITLKESFEESSDLRNIISDSKENELIFKVAKRIEGIPRHYSTHAAGIVLSKKPMTDIVAVQLEDDGINLTQQTKNNVESVGLLKMDFLGLRNLTILDTAIQMITNQYGREFMPEKIPLNDPETLQLFQRGQTDGVFQFESDGIRSVLRRLKPTSFDDVVATNALYRPGPMQNIATFIARKHGDEPVTYPDDSLKKILQPTYGILVYQEQVMQVSSQMAGFSLADADILRRAISKKNETLMQENHQKFVNGAVKKGVAKESSENVYHYIETFGNYGFNKSHSVAYSMIAFWLAYIKVHFSGIFYTCLLNSNLNNESKISQYIQDAKDSHIKIKNVNINNSQSSFTFNDGSIQFGLLNIKGVRRDLAQDILEERIKNGEYSNPRNFLQRIDKRFVKSEYLEPLILSGAFDGFNKNRRELLLDFRDLTESIQLSGSNLSLFDVLEPKKHEVNDFTLTEKLNQEKKYLGIYVSGHPVEKIREKLLNTSTIKISQLDQFKQQNVNIVGLVRDVHVIRTKKGQQMCFLSLEDETGKISVTVFPRLFQKLSEEELDNNIFLIVGRSEDGRRGDLEFIADKINKPNQYMVKLPEEKLYLKIPSSFSEYKLRELYTLIEKDVGKVPVILYFDKNKQAILLKQNRWVRFNDDMKTELVKMLGEKNVYLKK